MVNSAFSWDSEVFLSVDSISEINLWTNKVDSPNCSVYWEVLTLPVKVSSSDASDSCGAFFRSDSELLFFFCPIFFCQNWSP